MIDCTGFLIATDLFNKVYTSLWIMLSFSIGYLIGKQQNWKEKALKVFDLIEKKLNHKKKTQNE